MPAVHVFVLAKPGEDHFVVRNQINALQKNTKLECFAVYAVHGTIFGVFGRSYPIALPPEDVPIEKEPQITEDFLEFLRTKYGGVDKYEIPKGILPDPPDLDTNRIDPTNKPNKPPKEG